VSGGFHIKRKGKGKGKGKHRDEFKKKIKQVDQKTRSW
jgi:hypothetical protein